MTCVTCNGYEFVEVDGLHEKVPCPDCPDRFEECPVHGQKVMLQDGVLAGKCWGCMNEAARAKQWMRDHRYTGAAA